MLCHSKVQCDLVSLGKLSPTSIPIMLMSDVRNWYILAYTSGFWTYKSGKILKRSDETGKYLPHGVINPLTYLLAGILPIKGTLHKRILTTFCSMLRDRNTAEYRIIRRQLALKDDSPKSWVVRVKKLLYQYHVPSIYRVISLWIWTVRQKTYQQLCEDLGKMVAPFIMVDSAHPVFLMEMASFTPLSSLLVLLLGVSHPPSQLYSSCSWSGLSVPAGGSPWEIPSSLPWYILPLPVFSSPSYAPFVSSQISYQSLLCIPSGNLCMGWSRLLLWSPGQIFSPLGGHKLMKHLV